MFYLYDFLPLNHMRFVVLYLRDSEVCDSCLHFLFLLLLLCLFHLVFWVAHRLINMFVQQLKELVDIPATGWNFTITLSCHRETFPSHELQ